MQYKIQSSEKTTASGAEYETKALLYLMSFSKDCNDVYYFVVDFFNDLTGVDRYSDRLWDVQSKGNKNTPPKQIGKELVTLLKNYISEIEFESYILFMGGVSNTVRVDNKKNVFNIDNVSDKAVKKIKEGLIEESREKQYIDENIINDKLINDFLSKVCFVVDDKSKSEYIKNIIEVNPIIIPEDIILEQIFDQIRDAQSSKKNNGNIEGITIKSTDEFLYYNRHLDVNEIKMLVLSRLVNNNIMQKGIPPSFTDIYLKFPKISRKDKLEDCQLSIARMLFDKNNADNFWEFFGDIYEVLSQDSNASIDILYKKLDRKILNSMSSLDTLSVKYFMAIVKDGMYAN
ncbi:hypothetical protein [Clostridium sporogenes]|uniref:hypothetical protein n=1 Tax=Clostridium sporogenes TaxID=1509 RepID=UPI0001794BA1|nr:hypothetical protein [Clostridium sporogenes]EDU36662.1 hypothetical protein CLOSPO_02830 [Clostridium sporogenes ATCC 15579]NFE66685.1 hypothetical protein [Clostridium sporogenes]